MCKLELLPCPNPKCSGNLGATNAGNSYWVYCQDCLTTGPSSATEHGAIFAWNAMPRMSTIIAWQFQAAGLALENQRLIKMVEYLASWGDAHPCVLDMACPFGSTYDVCNLARDSAECWKEMARRAVEGK